jgi:serine/threonine-protein kinase
MTAENSLVVAAAKFGKYEIIRKLSRSMTDVYLARDGWTNRPVVLKKIEHSRDEFTRLIIEAETRGAQIQRQLHQIDPRILEVYEFGEQDGCFFVAMEYFEGKTLAELLEAERRLEARRAARYAAEICSQLRTLHAFLADVTGKKTAVVHGDIKPSNVQIGLKDDLKLLDFGIAKVITSTHHLTGHNLGSPSYCSPERLSKAQVDVHADLWALGVSLFEMLAGSPPYQAQDTRQLENLIQSKRPPRALPEDCPGALQAIVSKALAGELDRRYASAEAFENDLQAFLEDRKPLAVGAAPSFDANATIEKIAKDAKRGRPTRVLARPVELKVRTQMARREIGNLAIALLAGLLAGLLLFTPLVYYYRVHEALGPLRQPRDYAHDPPQLLATDWGLYKGLLRKNAFLGGFSPVAAVGKPLRANLLGAAENILDSFRSSSDSKLSDFDWARARTCLRRALEIDGGDTVAKGELALCDGYFNLAQNPHPPKASLSIDSFRQAASYLPRSPDPHLGLARLYIYAFHNVGEALAEFQQAQRLGFTLGAREMAQQADGFLYRSEWELSHARRVAGKDQEEAGKWLEMAREDIEKSRKLYEPLLGFANVSASLEQVYTDRNEQIRLAKASLETPVTLVTSKPSRATRRPAAKAAKHTTRRRQLGQAGRQPWR